MKKECGASITWYSMKWGACYPLQENWILILLCLFISIFQKLLHQFISIVCQLLLLECAWSNTRYPNVTWGQISNAIQYEPLDVLITEFRGSWYRKTFSSFIPEIYTGWTMLFFARKRWYINKCQNEAFWVFLSLWNRSCRCLGICNNWQTMMYEKWGNNICQAYSGKSTTIQTKAFRKSVR